MTTRFVKELSALVSSLPFLWVTGVAPAAAQERECGDRGAIRARVMDQSGFVPLARAEVVIHWSDVDRTPLRRGVGDAGYVVTCAPRDARRATLWAEIDDESSEQAVVDLQPGESKCRRPPHSAGARPARPRAARWSGVRRPLASPLDQPVHHEPHDAGQRHGQQAGVAGVLRSALSSERVSRWR